MPETDRRRLVAHSATAMEALGARLAGAVPRGVIYLCGELGAGKTTLVRGLLRALGFAGVVKSPTYTLVEPYVCGDRPVYHFDLYRICDPEELELIGIRDYFTEESLCLVEWPERAVEMLPDADIAVQIDVVEEHREVELIPSSASGRRLLTSFFTSS